MIDPRKCNVGLDANALDENSEESAVLVRRFMSLVEARTLCTIVPLGVRSEVLDRRAPGSVQDAFRPRIFNMGGALNHEQKMRRIRVRAILRGDAHSGKHDADASHLCEAGETGCVYFITHDKRILRKRGDLRQALPSLTILTLAKFFEMFDQFEAVERGPRSCDQITG